MDRVLLSVIVPEDMQDDVADILLSADWLSGFTLRKVQGHSREHGHFNVIEQVQGFSDMLQLELLLAGDELPKAKQCLQQLPTLHGLRYWVLPVLESDHL